MGDKGNIHWEPDIRKGMEELKNIKDIKKKVKKNADKRAIDGYNSVDLEHMK